MNISLDVAYIAHTLRIKPPTDTVTARLKNASQENERISFFEFAYLSRAVRQNGCRDIQT
jgi:hypothetical protein